MKKITRRAFLKASAATAAMGAAACAGLPAFAAEAESSTAGDKLARKAAAWGLTEGHTSEYDPAEPYLNVNVGLFHDVPITVDDNTSGTATYYLPDGMSPWAPAVIVMTPNNTTAKEFSTSITGWQWRAVAARNKIGVAFLEPANGGEWNLELSASGRDDAAVLDQLYQVMRKKSTKLKATFSMDKSHTALVGYKEGGAAALLFGGRWASDFSSICAVEATEVPAAALAELGEKYVLPFPGDSTRGVEEEAIAAKTVDTPVWFVASTADGKNQTVLDYYLTANKAAAAEPNAVAEAVYASGREGSASQVWVSASAQSPNTIWNNFSGHFKRFMAIQLPGRVAVAQDFGQAGFTAHEETVNGEVRRWLTYVPSSYTGEPMPLVLVMHGYTASMYAIAEESRWYDVAEKNGFIVLFAQGLVRPADLMGNIPTAMWLAGAFSVLASEGTDPDVDIKFIDTLLTMVEAEYSIDTTRIYATGHSNGSLMTWAVGTSLAERIAAIAPIGYMWDATDYIDENIIMPTWSFLGEYDSAGDPELVEGGTTVKTLQAWNKHNGVDEDTVAQTLSCNDAFVTQNFCNDEGVPLVRFTEVKDTPHVYLQEESEAIWDEFFSRYSRGENGTLYYEAGENGELVAVLPGEYNANSGWYTAE